jgi:hypothetical protein
MAVPFPIPPLLLAIMGGAFLFVLAGLSIVPPLATGVRQAAYERAVGRELVRLEVILPANVELDADATAELIRALHPGQRRGVDWFRVGWPPIELRFLWRDGVMHWQIDCPATEAGSAVLSLEIDEGTEHRRTIPAKFAAYRRPLATRPNCHLLVVVPGPIRAAWMVRAASLDLGPRSWVVTRTDLAGDSLDTVPRLVRLAIGSVLVEVSEEDVSLFSPIGGNDQWTTRPAELDGRFPGEDQIGCSRDGAGHFRWIDRRRDIEAVEDL